VGAERSTETNLKLKEAALLHSLVPQVCSAWKENLNRTYPFPSIVEQLSFHSGIPRNLPRFSRTILHTLQFLTHNRRGQATPPASRGCEESKVEREPETRAYLTLSHPNQFQ
jgi:hypothetical protein